MNGNSRCLRGSVFALSCCRGSGVARLPSLAPSQLPGRHVMRPRPVKVHPVTSRVAVVHRQAVGDHLLPRFGHVLLVHGPALHAAPRVRRHRRWRRRPKRVAGGDDNQAAAHRCRTHCRGESRVHSLGVQHARTPNPTAATASSSGVIGIECCGSSGGGASCVQVSHRLLCEVMSTLRN